MPAKIATPDRRWKILIVDDHPIVRHGLHQLLANEPDIEVCGEASTVAETLQKAQATDPDLAILDVSLGDEDGLTLIKDLKLQNPGIKILVSSIHREDKLAPRVMRLGAAGYIEKRHAIGKILEAVRCILRGEIYVSPELSQRAINLAYRGEEDPPDDLSAILSAREFEVFEGLGRGETVRHIAKAMGISPGTVESYRKKIKEKLQLRTSAELSFRAFTWVYDHE
ncbi:MAG: response regulator transcription factor [Planctomycetes bacterium]|nr:response regulator transcription factor [Planctomycetota bacterium]